LGVLDALLINALLQLSCMLRRCLSGSPQLLITLRFKLQTLLCQLTVHCRQTLWLYFSTELQPLALQATSARPLIQHPIAALNHA